MAEVKGRAEFFNDRLKPLLQRWAVFLGPVEGVLFGGEGAFELEGLGVVEDGGEGGAGG